MQHRYLANNKGTQEITVWLNNHYIRSTNATVWHNNEGICTINSFLVFLQALLINSIG